MPNLKHLLDNLEDLGVEPKQIHIPGQPYDNLVSDSEYPSEGNPINPKSYDYVRRIVEKRFWESS